MLVDPVRHEPADDVLAPPRLGADVVDPSAEMFQSSIMSWSSKIMASVRPTTASARPRASTIAVQPRVLLEVGGDVVGRLARDVGGAAASSCAVPSATDRRRRSDRRDDDQVRPFTRLLAEHPQAVGASASTPCWRGSRPGSRSCGGWWVAEARQLPNRTRSGPRLGRACGSCCRETANRRSAMRHAVEFHPVRGRAIPVRARGSRRGRSDGRARRTSGPRARAP